MTKSVVGRKFYQWKAGNWEPLESGVVTERAVSLTVNGENWLSFMCTPTDLEALAVGFLFNEKLIEGAQDIVSVRVCPTGDNVDVWLEKNVECPKTWKRTSGCTGGVTAAGENSKVRFPSNGYSLQPQQITELILSLIDSQNLYKKVGGIHTTVLSDGQNILLSAEDIGRHNTLDKIAGRMLMENIQPERKILVTTGRVSSEMMQKAARIGATIVITRTSPTNLSVEMAETLGITLIGYARRDQFIVYAHSNRVGSFNGELEEGITQNTLQSTLPKDRISTSL